MKKHIINMDTKHSRRATIKRFDQVFEWICCAIYVVMVGLILAVAMMFLNSIIPSIFNLLYLAISTNDTLEYHRYLLLLVLILTGASALIAVCGRFFVCFTKEMQKFIDTYSIYRKKSLQSRRVLTRRQDTTKMIPLYEECHSCSMYKGCRLSNATYRRLLNQAGLEETIDAFIYNHTYLAEICRKSVVKSRNQHMEVSDCAIRAALEYGYQIGQTEGLVEGFRRGDKQAKAKIWAELDDN